MIIQEARINLQGIQTGIRVLLTVTVEATAIARHLAVEAAVAAAVVIVQDNSGYEKANGFMLGATGIRVCDFAK
jgi:hypothetical protein